MGCGSGVLGQAAVMRQAPVGHGIRPGEHRRPRGRGGTQPGRSSWVWNVVTPTGSGTCVVSGKPTVRKAQIPGGTGMTREANAGGRKAAGNRDGRSWPLLPGVSDNRPDTGPWCPAAKAG
jgi:hypothetical protein